MLKRFFKSKLNVEDIALSLGIKSAPSSKNIAEKREALVASLFFDLFKTLADSIPEKTPEHTYSWEVTNHRVKLTAYGAFIHKNDVCKTLFDMNQYSHNKLLATAGITPQMRQDDRDFIRDTISKILIERGYDHLELLELKLDDLSVGDPKLYYAIYARIIFVLHTYTFHVPDLTFITRNLIIALCDCIVGETHREKPEVAVLAKYEKLAEAAIACTFPLSLNTYSELRNGLPKNISSRMHSIQYKVMKLNKDEYVSPLESFRRRQSKEKLNG